jgi:hypothetical protein
MKCFFKTVDFLGPEVSIKVKEKNTLSSNSGGILSLTVIILSVLAFIGFGRDLIEKKQPQVTSKKEVDQNITMTFKDDSIIFAIMDQVTLQEIPDFDRKIYFYFHYVQVLGNNQNTIYTPIKAERCSKNILDKVRNLLLVPDYNYYCLPRGSNVTIKGSEQQGEYDLLRLNADICKNITSTSNCFPADDIRANLGKLKMQYIIPDGYGNNYNYSEPGVSTTYLNFPVSNVNTMSRQVIYYKTMEYNTDKGWIMEDTVTHSYKIVDQIAQLFIPVFNTGTIYSHLFANSLYKDVYNRQYIKIQGVFAYIGGFINIFLLITRAINLYLNQPMILKLFSDVLTNTNIEKSDKFNKIARKFFQENDIINNFDGKIFYLQSNEDKHINSTVSKLKNLMELSPSKKKDRDNRLQSPTLFVKLCRVSECAFSSKTRKQLKLISFWQKIYNQKMSLENFAAQTRRFDLIKNILFKDYQKFIIERAYYRYQDRESITDRQAVLKLINEKSEVNDELLKLIT